MTIAEVFTMLQTISTVTGKNIPVAYDHFTSKVAPPCIVFNVDDMNVFYADDIAYYSQTNYQVVLTTAIKDIEIESALESIFETNNIVFEKSEAYINNELMYEIVYNF